jgi:transposase
METLHPVAAGIDVHRDTVVVSIRKRDARAQEEVETRTFETFHDTLEQMVRWLDDEQVPIVGLESTGVYWKPVVRVLRLRSPERVVWLVNPTEVKKVPGRKTDVTDSQWLSKLVMHGLVSPSFLPSVELEELRKLTRFRTKLIGEQTSAKNRIIKEMEGAGIKLASVCSDPLGKSGRAMLEALLEGTQTPAQIAQLAQGMLRTKRAQLERAVCGSFSPSSQFILKMLLQQLQQVEDDLKRLDAQIQLLLKPFQPQVELLRTVPGLDTITIAAVLAEIGPDMRVFRSADHLTAWGGLCPGSNESAGKPKRAPARKGDKYLRTSLTQAAWSAVRTKRCAWKETFGRLVRRLGPNKAIVAIARKMLVALFYILRDGVPYKPLPQASQTLEQRLRSARRHVEALAALGFQIDLAQVMRPEPTGPGAPGPQEGTFS